MGMGSNTSMNPTSLSTLINEDVSELILEVSHGLKRFYEADLCRHVHQDRGTLGLKVSQWLKHFYEPDFIVDKV